MNGVFEGSISTGDESYHIEPANRYCPPNHTIHRLCPLQMAGAVSDFTLAACVKAVDVVY